MRKALSIILLTIFLIPNIVFAYDVPDITADYVYFYNFDNDEIIYEVGIDKEIPIASLNKIMTASVALDKIENLDDKITITKKDYQGLIAANAARLGFKAGEVLTYRDLLYSLLLPSAADAALALANNLYGSEENMVKAMNEKAKKLGLEHTTYKNVVGLDSEGQHSTLREFAIILKDMLENEDFYKIFTTTYYETTNGQHKMYSSVRSTSKKYKVDYDYIIGSKTGFTYDAGLCLATLSKYNDKTYLLVIANSNYKFRGQHLVDTMKVYNYFFKNFDYREVVTKGTKIIDIVDENEDVHSFYVSDSKTMYLPNNSKIDVVIDAPDLLNYGMKKGSVIGKYSVYVDEEEVYSERLFLDEDINKPYVFPIKAVLITVGVILLIFFLLVLKIRRKRRRRRKKKNLRK